MPDVIELLKQDHREVEQLFGAFERDPQPSIAAEICAQLELHTTAEEHFVYPVLRERVSDGKKLADEAEHEHAQAKQIIGRVKRTRDPEHLAEAVAELQHAIEHHVEEEEGTVFPKMESNLGKIELEAVGANVQEFKGSA
jgi:iron-sulfur cluster repair protein YtfE (RIC family)